MNDIFTYLAPLCGFLAVVFLIPIFCKLALEKGYVDEPGGRKDHAAPVPPIGGKVIFPVFIALSLFLFDLSIIWPLVAGLIILIVTGILDDKEMLPAWPKFGLHFLAAFIIVVFGGANVTNLSNLMGFGDVYLGWFSWFFSLFCVTLLINSMNLMDGLDGLAGGKSFIVFGWLLVAAIFVGNNFYILSLSLLMAVLAGFLVYNMRSPWRSRASVFLGDAGSMGLGLCMAWFCITMAQDHAGAAGPAILEPMAVAFIIAHPVMDACGQFIRRIREGRHPFDADRGHLHHHFVHAGLSAGQATAVILCIGFVLGAFGYFGSLFGVPDYVMFALWCALLFFHVGMSQKPERYTKFIEKAFKKT